jgi:hypothetical protein
MSISQCLDGSAPPVQIGGRDYGKDARARCTLIRQGDLNRSLVRASEPGCFESRDRPMRLHLIFFELKEGLATGGRQLRRA